MADFGVYINVTNNTGKPLNYRGFATPEPDCCKPNYPEVIPSDGVPRQIHLTDPCSSTGAEGTITYANDGSADTAYSWHGDCPVWSSDNQADGPGILSWNRTGHPLTVSVYLGAAPK
jgi:hypothetical protein